MTAYVLPYITAYTLCDISVDGILNGIFSWFAEKVGELFDAVASMFLDVLGADLTVFDTYFPFMKSTYSVMQWIGWFLLLAIVIWQLFRSFLGPLSDAENPLTLIGRSVIAAFCIGFAIEIMNILLTLAADPYNQLLNFSFTSNDFSFVKLSSALSAHLASIATGSVLSILLIIMIVAIGWTYCKLLLESVERYVVIGVLTYSSPVAFSMSGSQSTANVFKAWCRMVGSQLFLLCMNVWFIRSFNYALGYYIISGGSVSGKSIAVPTVLWLFCALAFLKIAQKMDDDFHPLGLSVAQTGGLVGQELMHTALMLSFAGLGQNTFIGSGLMPSRGGMGGAKTATAGNPFSTLANKFKGGSYALDAVRSNTDVAFGGKGITGAALRGAFGSRIASGKTALTAEQIGKVAGATPNARLGNIVDGAKFGAVATNGLKQYMPAMAGTNLQSTSIGAGKINSTAITPDGKQASLEFSKADQHGMPNGAIAMSAADGSKWYMTATGDGAGGFSIASKLNAGDSNLANVGLTGFSPNATVLSTGDGEMTIQDGANASTWYSTLNHTPSEVPVSYMTAANGERFYTEPSIANTERYDGNEGSFSNDFSSFVKTQNYDVTNVSSSGEGQLEFYDKNSGSWYRMSDANHYSQPANSAVVADNNGNQYNVEQSVGRQVTTPVYDDRGNIVEGATNTIDKHQYSSTRRLKTSRKK